MSVYMPAHMPATHVVHLIYTNSAINEAAKACNDDPAQKKKKTWDLRDLGRWNTEVPAAIEKRDEANTQCNKSLLKLTEATRYKTRLEKAVEVLRSQGSQLHAPYVDLSHLYLSILVRMTLQERTH